MSNHFLGYQHGLREPGIETEITLPKPNLVNFDNFDLHMLAIFGQNFDYQNDISHSYSSAEEQYLHRLLVLISYLQRISDVPTFEVGKILSFHLNDLANELSAKVFIPYIDFANLNLLKHVIVYSRDLAKLLVSDFNQTEVNLEKYWKSIETQIVNPLKRHIQSGVSTIPILNAASQQRIPFRHLGEGIYQVGIGKELRIISKSAVDTDSSIGAYLSSKKDLSARLIKLAGLPAPRHISVLNIEQAQQAAQKIGFPVVIKPSDSERSEGVTTNIYTSEDVVNAYQLAKKRSKNIIVERQIPGVCYRLMIANNKFLYAVKRLPRLLVGDGLRSIQELFDADKKINSSLPPWQRKKSISLDQPLLNFINSQGFELNSVPPKGKYVYLRLIESTEWGETTFDVTDEVCPENIEIAEKAARILNLNNAGVDIITTDISKPYWQVGGVINEINYRPHFGGTIAAKSRMAQYINDLVKNQGSIPIEVYIGGDDALNFALKRHKKFLKEGIQSFMVNHESIWSTTDKVDHPQEGIFKLTQRLLLNRSTELLIMVVSTDELIRTGLPVHTIHKLKRINDQIQITNNKADSNDVTLASAIESMFKPYLSKRK